MVHLRCSSNAEKPSSAFDCVQVVVLVSQGPLSHSAQACVDTARHYDPGFAACIGASEQQLA